MPEEQLPTITDEVFTETLSHAREYTLAIVKRTERTSAAESQPIIWEHGRRNMALRAAGILAVVCPVIDDSEVAGIGVFSRSAEEVSELIDHDPAIEAGVLRYEVHPVRGLPGDSLPA